MAERSVSGDGKNPLEYFYHWEKARANEVFLTQPAGGQVRDITWKEAGNEVRRMAAWLAAQYPRGSRIAIIAKNSAHWILADLAIMMAGHVSVPIYPTFNADALRYILEHSESQACFIGKLDDTGALADGIPAAVQRIALPLAPPIEALSWDALIATAQPMSDNPVPADDELWTIVYTSGTTGRPKGVMQAYGALRWCADSARQRISLSPDDRIISYLPLAHIFERIVVEMAVLHYGFRLYFADTLATFIEDVKRARPTLFISVPRLWTKFQQGVFAKMPEQKLKRLLRIPILGRIVARKVLTGLGLEHCRFAGSGAAPLPADVLMWYRSLGLDLIEGYGMTENCAVSHAVPPGVARPGTVGTAIAGVECRIDPESGEILMRSPAVMKGYYKDPEATAASITPDGWLRTGDKGSVDRDGYLTITGRVKDIFKTAKGKYVAPAPIENLLAGHPAIEVCVVTGGNFAQPLALVMLSPEVMAQANGGARAQIAESLAQHVRSVNDQLEAHEKLQCVAVVGDAWTPESGFVTPTLKVRRTRIEDAYAGRYAAWVETRETVVWA